MGQRSTPRRFASYLAPSVIANKPAEIHEALRWLGGGSFPNGQTRRAQIGIAADFHARAESSNAQFQSARLARD